MATSTLDEPSIAEDPVGMELDNEIETLQAQIASLKAQRKLQSSTILSSRATQAALQRLRASQKSSLHTNPETDVTPLIKTTTAQRSHNQQNLYRACASITSFRIRDPDPNAVDDGNVLGIRIDVSGSGKFVKPYYVMLNKPFPDSDLLRIHRHTIPPCIPLESLAKQYLPCGKGVAMSTRATGPGSMQQDLPKFVRALRCEIAGYNNRLLTIKSLRKEFNLDAKPSMKGKSRVVEKVIEDVAPADAEAKLVRIDWVDGKIGRVHIGEKGELIKAVVVGDEGRDWDMERRLVPEYGKSDMLGIAERLKEGIY